MTEQKQNTDAMSETGVTEWKVTGELLRKFKAENRHQELSSSPFKTIDGTIWPWAISIHLDPYFSSSVYLQCVTLNDNKHGIGVNYSFNIANLGGVMFMEIHLHMMEKYVDQSMPMTIECVVEETMDVSGTNTYFEWKVDNYWMEQDEGHSKPI
eukprot:123189_1